MLWVKSDRVEGFDAGLARKVRPKAVRTRARFDADLVRSNRARYKLAVVLLAFGFLLVLLSTVLKPSGVQHKVGMILAGVLIVAGIGNRALGGDGNAFLSKTDP